MYIKGSDNPDIFSTLRVADSKRFAKYCFALMTSLDQVLESFKSTRKVI